MSSAACRRVLLLGLAASLVAVAALMDAGYVTVTATVQLMDIRDIQAELTCDFEDAMEIVGAAKPWMTEQHAWDAIQLRAEMLGWTYDSQGWLRGREFHVRVQWQGTHMDVVYVYMRRGELLVAMVDPALSVCGSPLTHPFPTLPRVIAMFNANAGGTCRELDRLYVMAAYRIMCTWFDLCQL